MIKRSLATHDGVFHADEVTACALLLINNLIDKDLIYRTRDNKIIAQCEYVCDVGKIFDPKNKKFDHHQLTYAGNLSSAGMVLKYLFDFKYIDKDLYDYFNDNLIKGIDDFDNGKMNFDHSVCSFSQVIANFLPVKYGASPNEQDDAFFEALDFIIAHLNRMKHRFEYRQTCKDKIEIEMKKNKKYLVFDEPLPWLENFFLLGGKDHPALFVIMPTEKSWKLRCIPPSFEDSMNMRLPLPEEWKGLHDEDLVKATNIKGAIFCHKSRFISIWNTKEDAVKAMHIVFKKNGVKE